HATVLERDRPRDTAVAPHRGGTGRISDSELRSAHGRRRPRDDLRRLRGSHVERAADLHPCRPRRCAGESAMRRPSTLHVIALAAIWVVLQDTLAPAQIAL